MPRKLTDNEVKRIRCMLDAGLSRCEIIAKSGRSDSTVTEIKKAYEKEKAEGKKPAAESEQMRLTNDDLIIEKLDLIISLLTKKDAHQCGNTDEQGKML